MPTRDVSSSTLRRRRLPIPVILALFIMLCLSPVNVSAANSLDESFRAMYGLKFDEARARIAEWEAQRPYDARGPVSEAADILFAELHRLGVLEAQFFVSDRSFSRRSKPAPDPGEKQRFDSALMRGEMLARKALETNNMDTDALFAFALANGLRADYAALVQKQNWESLQFTLRASEFAKMVIQFDPGYYDAYLSTGISQYIVGNLPFPVRWFLRIGGYVGDRDEGLRQLRLVSDRGRLLAPFARLILAIAYLRGKHVEEARKLLENLRDEFPTNPLFSKELLRIENAKQ